MNTANSVDTTTIIVEMAAAGELAELSQASQKLEAVYSNILDQIHRFPASLRSLDGDYIVPRMVAIGAYHRGLPELQDMEEIKKATAYHFCGESGLSPEAVYQKVLAVAGDARSCYTDGELQRVTSDEDFAPMMFRDGCFLLQTILWILQQGGSHGVRGPPLPSFSCKFNSTALLRDLFLLENQIPWVVLKALMECRLDVFPDALREFIVHTGKFFQLHTDTDLLHKPLDLKLDGDWSYKPAHLLALLHFHHSGGSSTTDELHLVGLETLPPVVTSAVDFAQTGIKLAPSKTAAFRDMALSKGPLFPELSMPPLFLSELTACWLVNMAAFESTGSVHHGPTSGHYTVSSYLTLLSMLMDRVEDVHELRAKRVIHSYFTNDRTLAFFKGGLTSYLYVNDRYLAVLKQIEEHKLEHWVWIAIHRFLYTNLKTIVMVLSIISVLVGIFKTLLSLQKSS